MENKIKGFPLNKTSNTFVVGVWISEANMWSLSRDPIERSDWKSDKMLEKSLKFIYYILKPVWYRLQIRSFFLL